MGLRKQKSMMEKAQEAAHEVAEQVKPQAAAATEKAAVLAQEGVKKARPVVGQGKVAAGNVVAQVVEAAAEAAEHAHQFAEEKAVAAGLMEDKKKKGGKFKKFLFVGVLVGAIGFVAKKLTAQKESDKWQPATPTPPAPRPTTASATAPTAAGAEEADDTAGADPAEALADAAETPHAVTTPDNPADVVDVPPTQGYSSGEKPQG